MQIRCPCGAVLSTPDHTAGQQVRCPKCQAVILVPQPPAPAAEAAQEQQQPPRRRRRTGRGTRGPRGRGTSRRPARARGRGGGGSGETSTGNMIGAIALLFCCAPIGLIWVLSSNAFAPSFKKIYVIIIVASIVLQIILGILVFAAGGAA